MNERNQLPFSQIENFTPDNEIYETASLIVQTTNKCSKNCPACYLSENTETKKQELSQDLFEKNISKLKEGDEVALRGGEISTVHNWFEKFVVPALNKGLKIIIETNGYFIGAKDYQNILEKMKSNNIFVRVSFDLEHIKNLEETDVASEFKKMAHFADDAKKTGINFGFYSLGMDKAQIQNFVQDTPLEPYIGKFHSLAFHSQISAVEIKGKYLKSNGDISKRIEV